ncbi:MAG: Farnesyl diphosphate synthase [Alphaproteobacteria bacterium ADurb.Bin438]|nr:MAG: Farnesyl diphosphate synthase [Alphaproteobacteria bacterium ADurb.Bin438]
MKETAIKVSEKLKTLLPDYESKGKILFDAMKYSTESGKRLRPFLLIESAKLFDIEEDQSLSVACALEMIHCFSLIHDDLPAIDNDDLRRGRPTCHKKFDEPTAILAGDGLLALAFKVINENDEIKPNIRSKLSLLLAESTFEMIEGEFIDILADKGHKFSLEEVINMQNLKTGALIAYATKAGGILGDANEKEMKALEKYGLNLGLAFQIADDILDVEGDPLKVGKKLRKDNNKATFVSLLGLDEAKKKATELIDEAINELLVFNGKGGKLEELAKFVIERDK